MQVTLIPAQSGLILQTPAQVSTFKTLLAAHSCMVVIISSSLLLNAEPAFLNAIAAGALGIKVMPASALSRLNSALCAENPIPLPSTAPLHCATAASPSTTLLSLLLQRVRTVLMMLGVSTVVRSMLRMTVPANTGRRDSTEVGSSTATKSRR